MQILHGHVKLQILMDDGDLDIVSASHNDDTIAWYENNGAADPTFTLLTDIATSADGASGVFIADIRWRWRFRYSFCIRK